MARPGDKSNEEQEPEFRPVTSQTPMHGVYLGPGGNGGSGVTFPATGSGGGGAGGIHVVSGPQHTLVVGRDREHWEREAAIEFLEKLGLRPTEDAVDQMVLVFLKCLRIMTERPWDPRGGTWRKSGVLGIMTDVRKKFERLWERGWRHGQRHDDSAYDLINYIGMYLRSEDNGWGEWGEPAVPGDDS